MSDFDDIRKGFRALSNEQLKRKCIVNNEEEAFISSRPIKDIIGHDSDSDSDYGSNSKKRKGTISSGKIGIKPNETTFRIPEIVSKNERDVIPREDGKKWDWDEAATHPYYGPDWINEEHQRSVLLQSDPNWIFLSLIAGFTQFKVEDLIAEEQDIATRQTFFQTQGKARTRAMTDIDSVKSAMRDKRKELKTARETESNQESMLAKIERTKITYKERMGDLIAFEELSDRSRYPFPDDIYSADNTFNINDLESEGGTLRGTGMNFSNYVWNYIIRYETIDPTSPKLTNEENTRLIIGKTMTERTEALLEKYVDEVLAASADGTVLWGPDLSKLISKTLGLQTTPLPSKDVLVAEMKKMDSKKFQKITSDIFTVDADGIGLYVSVALDVLLKTYLFIIKRTQIDGNIYEEYKEFLSEFISAGDFAIPAKVELLKRRYYFFKEAEECLEPYTYDKPNMYKIDISNNTLIDMDFRLSIAYQKATDEAMQAIRNYDAALSTTPADAKTNLQTALLNKTFSDQAIVQFGTLYGASRDIKNGYYDLMSTAFVEQKKRTHLFNTILDEITSEERQLLLKRIEVAKKNSFYYIIAYHDVLERYLVKALEQSKKLVDDVEKEYDKYEDYYNSLLTNKGAVKLNDLELPYRQRPQWVLAPRHSGFVQLNPLVVSAIALAKTKLTEQVDPYLPKGSAKFSEIDFEQLQVLDPVNVTLAQLVAALMAFPSIEFPGSNYRFKDSAKMAQLKVKEVLSTLRRYKITQKPRGADGKKRYKVELTPPKDVSRRTEFF